MSYRWDMYFLGHALLCAHQSKDPSTQVGCVIVGPDREIRATGFNGLPRGLADTQERLFNRELKLQLIVHAEQNAVCAAARVGVSVKGCTLYLAATDAGKSVWGGCPCTRCLVHVAQAGIIEIVSHPFKNMPSRWLDDITQSRLLAQEMGILVREIPYPDGPDL